MLRPAAGPVRINVYVNVSPEPVSNIVVSTGEDVATGGMLALAFASPEAAVVIALIALGFAVMVLIYARKAMRSLLRLRDRIVPPPIP